MLLQFTVSNYKTFEKEAKLSMLAAHYTEKMEDNVIEVPKFGLKILKSAVVYGANASGKTKLFEALNFMIKFIKTSAKNNAENENIGVESFLLSENSEKQPSLFEIIFIYDNGMYRYGFEITKEKVLSEWLYHTAKKKETELFYRTEQKFDLNKNFKVDDLVERKRIKSNVLLLSIAEMFNDEIANNIVNIYLKKIIIISGLNENPYMGYTKKLLDNFPVYLRILSLIQKADLSILSLTPKDATVEEIPESLSDNLKKFYSKEIESGKDIFTDIHTEHQKYDEHKISSEEVTFSMRTDESSGTRKFFALAGLIITTLDNGLVLFVDELDAKLHPNLTYQLIKLFHNKTTNPLNAQLVFNTHDTNLLDADIFRRDQIWFTEKDRYGAATLYSLAEIKGVRKDDKLEKNYIQGKYGAIPYLGDFSNLFNAE